MSIQKEDVFFSIIIPVYNVEGYLRQCLDSILCQSYSNFEIVLVNDGSIDSSLEICLEYQEKSAHVKLINKENEGVSTARNIGLLRAKGDYIIFTDGDDFWIGKQVLEELNNLIQESDPDLIIHEETRFFTDKDLIYKNNQRFILNKSGKFEDEVLNLVYYDLFAASPWDKVIKKSVLIDNKLFFPVGKKSEDISLIINNKAKVYEEIGDYNAALKIYEKSIRNVSKNTIDYARTLNNIAITKWLQDDTYDPLPAYFEALTIRKNKNDISGLNSSYGTLADYYRTCFSSYLWLYCYLRFYLGILSRVRKNERTGLYRSLSLW